MIVAWQDLDELDETFAAVTSQTAEGFEVIVADNGAGLSRRLEPWLSKLNMVHLDLGENRGVSAARNAAVAIARSNVICFLDDDAVPAPDWIESLCAAVAVRGVVAARGRVVPREATMLNELARAYDLGDSVRPAILNTEGNCVVDRTAFAKVGGFNEDMFGHEGAELSTRILAQFGDGAIVYTPDAVISHDYVSSVAGYLRKRFRHGSMIKYLDLGQARAAAARSVRRSPWTIRRVMLIPVKVAGVVVEVVGLLWSRIAHR